MSPGQTIDVIVMMKSPLLLCDSAIELNEDDIRLGKRIVYKYTDISDNSLKNQRLAVGTGFFKRYIGAKIFTQLARHTFLEFLKMVDLPKGICAIPIDDHVRHGYSHSAILAKATQPYLMPLYGALRAKMRRVIRK